MHAECSMLPSEIAQIIVSCVENAVGDDIRSDIRRNRLKTTNSVPARIWDLMNTNLIDSLELHKAPFVYCRILSQKHRASRV